LKDTVRLAGGIYMVTIMCDDRGAPDGASGLRGKQTAVQ
jgi:hypothetical protein